jgi:hypothetical protein
MARAIDWAIQRDPAREGSFLALNVGCDEWNYQVKDLAEAVAQVIPGIEVSINKDAQPDKRSYRVSFKKFKQLAAGYTPRIDLKAAIAELRDGLRAIDFKDENFRRSSFIRLNVLTDLRDKGVLTGNLKWALDTLPHEKMNSYIPQSLSL